MGDKKNEKIYPKFKNYNGFLVSQSQNYLSAVQYQVQPGDVFICTYPKCGTTWMQKIVYLIQHEAEALPVGKCIGDYIPFLDMYGKDNVEQIPPPRTLKTHFPPNIFPLKSFAKYIFVARNPKDCCVSLYFHMLGFSSYEFKNGKFDDMFDLFLQGETEAGGYFEYLLSWNSYLNDENVLFLTYEQMKIDLKNCVLKIAKFLGEEYEQKILNNESFLQKIVDQSSFKSMQQMESKNQFEFVNRPANLPFIRKGEIGDWKNYFSQEQSRLLDEKFEQCTKGTIFESIWDDVM